MEGPCAPEGLSQTACRAAPPFGAGVVAPEGGEGVVLCGGGGRGVIEGGGWCWVCCCCWGEGAAGGGLNGCAPAAGDLVWAGSGEGVVLGECCRTPVPGLGICDWDHE